MTFRRCAWLPMVASVLALVNTAGLSRVSPVVGRREVKHTHEARPSVVDGGVGYGGDDVGHGDAVVRRAPVWLTGGGRTSHLHHSGASLPGYRAWHRRRELPRGPPRDHEVSPSNVEH